MARNGLFGKLFAVAAAAAAIGGACYIFRDKIKASRLYEELDVDDKLHSLKNMLKKEEEEEDFFEEDEYIFNTDEEDSNRTYVSLTPESAAVTEPEEVPTITLDMPSDVTTLSENSFATDDASADNTSSEIKDETPSGYDMEGLSDVSEDPDVLVEQDLLDESPFEFY